MKQITSFNIDSSDLKATISSRYLTILGDAGSKFVLYISNEDLKYYNFETNVFATAETKITAEIPNSGTYTKEITFPVVTDDDQYDFKLLVNPHYEVELSEGLSPKNPVLYTTSIAQKVDSVVTFAVATTTSGTTEFQAMPDNVTLTKPPLSTDTHDISISWTIKATDAVAGGALVIDRQILDTDFKFTITPESIGAGSAGTVIYLNSVENLIKGMSLITIESETCRKHSPLLQQLVYMMQMIIYLPLQSSQDQ